MTRCNYPQYPAWSVYPITQPTLLTYTEFRWSLRYLGPHDLFGLPVAVFEDEDEAKAECERRIREGATA